MRSRLVFGLLCALLLAAIVAASALPTPRVQADTALQGVPRLDGYNIYFSEAFGEASRFDRSGAGVSRFAGLLQMLGANLYTLEWRTGIPSDADLLVIPGPTQDIAADETAWLWAYLQNGGRLLLISEPMVPGVRALPSARGLMALMWTDMGLRGRDDVVVIEGGMREVLPPEEEVEDGEPTPPPPAPVEMPALVAEFTTGSLNGASGIASDVAGDLAFSVARSLEVDETLRDATVTTLISSADNFYGETEYADYLEEGLVEYNIGTDTTRSSLALAASFEKPSTGTRVVLIGDREFATNTAGFQTSPPYSSAFLYPGNVRFMLNAVAWLLGAEPVAGELSFPSPADTATPTITPSPTPIPPTATPEPAS
ncbi:MAG: hypothetical protein GX613_16880 [Chloroflexi bacterium]|nr:hypothetical protein [Chloroflexota bacterium]